MGCFMKTDIKLATVDTGCGFSPSSEKLNRHILNRELLHAVQSEVFWTATHFYYIVSGPHNHIHPSIL